MIELIIIAALALCFMLIYHLSGNDWAMYVAIVFLALSASLTI